MRKYLDLVTWGPPLVWINHNFCHFEIWSQNKIKSFTKGTQASALGGVPPSPIFSPSILRSAKHQNACSFKRLKKSYRVFFLRILQSFQKWCPTHLICKLLPNHNWSNSGNQTIPLVNSGQFLKKILQPQSFFSILGGEMAIPHSLYSITTIWPFGGGFSSYLDGREVWSLGCLCHWVPTIVLFSTSLAQNGWSLQLSTGAMSCAVSARMQSCAVPAPPWWTTKEQRGNKAPWGEQTIVVCCPLPREVVQK